MNTDKNQRNRLLRCNISVYQWLYRQAVSRSVVLFVLFSGCASVQQNKVESALEKAQVANTVEAYEAFLSEYPDAGEVSSEAKRLKERVSLHDAWLGTEKDAYMEALIAQLKHTCEEHTGNHLPKSAYPELRNIVYGITQVLKRDFGVLKGTVGGYLTETVDRISKDRYEVTAPNMPKGCHFFIVSDKTSGDGIIVLKGLAYHLIEVDAPFVFDDYFLHETKNVGIVDLTYIDSGAIRYNGKSYQVDGMIYFNGKLYTRGQVVNKKQL